MEKPPEEAPKLTLEEKIREVQAATVAASALSGVPVNLGAIEASVRAGWGHEEEQLKALKEKLRVRYLAAKKSEVKEVKKPRRKPK